MSYITIIDNEKVLLVLLLLATFALLSILLRQRYYCLLIRYAKWQNEEQTIAEATHDAINAIDSAVSDPSVSIIIPCNESELPALEQLLPRLFSQNYKGKFEIVVVNEDNSALTKDKVSSIQEYSPNLRYSFIPSSSRNIEKRKLAITIGIKASHGIWAIILNANVRPVNDNWLSHYVQHFSSETNFVSAYYNYDNDWSTAVKNAILDRISNVVNQIVANERGEYIINGDVNWAVRCSWFIEQQGFAESLILPFGEEAILANHRIEPRQGILLFSPSTKLVEEVVYENSKTLLYRQIINTEISHHLNGRSRLLLRFCNAQSLAPLIFLLSILAYITIRFVSLYYHEAYDTSSVAFDAIFVLLLTVSISASIVCAKKLMKSLHENIPCLFLLRYSLLKPFRLLQVSLLRIGHKQDFNRNYL